MAVMYGKPEAIAELTGPNHFFIPRDELPYKFEPGGANHEGCAGLLGLGDYLNVPLTRDEYETFVSELLEAETVPLHEFEKALYFEGCLPLEEMARRQLVDAGYVQVGLDHFALPSDPLAEAASRRTVHRDFMGYTTERSPTLIGLGVSSISEVPQGLAQNVKKLSTYESALNKGRLPIEKGCVTHADDLVRREVIMRLMCDLELRFGEIERSQGINFPEYFEPELRELREPGGLISSGIVRETGVGLVVEPAARSLVRNVCYVFDRRGKRSQTAAPGMSSAV